MSAAAYPKFDKWSKDRTVRSATEKVIGMITSANTQAQKGYYPFVQFVITPGSKNVTFKTKGMSQNVFNYKLNQSTTKYIECKIDDSGYWDNNEIDVLSAEVNVNINKDSAVCFSKDGTHFSEKEQFHENNLQQLSLDGRNSSNYFIICSNKIDSSSSLPSSAGTVGKCTEEPLYLVEWSRFGNIKKYRYGGKTGKKGWNRQ